MNARFKLKNCFRGVVVLMLIIGAVKVNAATLSLSSATDRYSIGDTLDIDVSISGLEGASLGAFDIFFRYAVPLEFQKAEFGTGLGVTLFDTAEITQPFRYIRIAQVSLESIAYLASNQPDSFRLATLSLLVSDFFDGSYPLGMLIDSSTVLSDAKGDPLSYNVAEREGLLLFEPRDTPPTAVPLPASWLLFLFSLAFGRYFTRWGLQPRSQR